MLSIGLGAYFAIRRAGDWASIGLRDDGGRGLLLRTLTLQGLAVFDGYLETQDRAAVEAMTPVTSAVKAGDFVTARKIVEDGSIKAARMEFRSACRKSLTGATCIVSREYSARRLYRVVP